MVKTEYFSNAYTEFPPRRVAGPVVLQVENLACVRGLRVVLPI